jgi:ribose-phosphate pyrophosphokinase
MQSVAGVLTTIKAMGIGPPYPFAHSGCTRQNPGRTTQEPGFACDVAEVSVNNGFTIFSGTANPALAQSIADELGTQVGNCVLERYPTGEVAVQILESVRRKEVLLMQPTSPPTNDHLIELFALADACHRAGSARIIAIVPFFGYGRADRRHGRREPIMARVVADLLEAVAIDHVVMVDPHTAQTEGFFHVPVDSLTAVPMLCCALRGHLPLGIVIVAPDAGRVEMANRYAQCLGAPVVVLHKRRISATETEVTHMAGEVSGRPCLIVDDMISTGATIAESIRALLKAGAQPGFTVAATHGLLVEDARGKLSHPAVREVLVTDTVDVRGKEWPRLRTISIAPLLAAAVRRLVADRSLRTDCLEVPHRTAPHREEKNREEET